MSEAGKQLLEAAREGLAFCKGEAGPGTYEIHAPPAEVDVKAIRKGLNMTQQVFGERFGFGPARIRDWEQKRTRPAASDRVLLVTIKSAPDVVLQALRSQVTEVTGKDGVVTAEIKTRTDDLVEKGGGIVMVRVARTQGATITGDPPIPTARKAIARRRQGPRVQRSM